MEKNSYKVDKILFYWLSFLFFFVVYYLYKKHTVGNDSSISEWLINYKGGFTRRGFGGEIAILLSNLLNISLRLSIFIIQLFFHLIFFILFYFFIKNIKLNILQIFCIFTPIFLIFPLGEIESLGRKEIILFCFFLLIVIFSDNFFSVKYNNFLIIFVLPIIILIWEEIVLFCPFILCVLIISRNQKNFSQIFLENILLFLPSILTFFYLFSHPLDLDGHKMMCGYLINYFNERCYMSANMLVTHTIYFDTFFAWHKNTHIRYYIEHFILTFGIGFLPLHLLLIKNKFIGPHNFIFKTIKPIYLFFLLYIPVSLLFAFAYDWGRWINIMYTFSIIFYFFLIKNNFLSNKVYINKFLKKYFYNRKKNIIFVFIIFALSWSQKTVLKESFGTFPVYRMIQKFIKWSFMN